MKRIFSLLLVLVMVLSMAACGSKTAEPTTGKTDPTSAPAGDNKETTPAEPAGEELADEQVFHYYMGSEPSTLDPWMNNSGAASIIVAAIHEPMLRPSLEGEGWVPGLCDSYEKNADSTVHTLHLREGAK